MDLHIEVHSIAMGNHGCSDTPNAEHSRGGACEQTEQYQWAAPKLSDNRKRHRHVGQRNPFAVHHREGRGRVCQLGVAADHKNGAYYCRPSNCDTPVLWLISLPPSCQPDDNGSDLVTVWDIAEPDLLSVALYQSGQTIL
jgi:hypothetical protein